MEKTETKRTHNNHKFNYKLCHKNHFQGAPKKGQEP